MIEPGSEQPEIADRPARQEPRRPDPRPEPRAAAPRFDRNAPRDYRRRDEDLGPAVIGFGDDIPAFMALPRRKAHAEPDPVDA
jgi:hypothetical protein